MLQLKKVGDVMGDICSADLSKYNQTNPESQHPAPNSTQVYFCQKQ